MIPVQSFPSTATQKGTAAAMTYDEAVIAADRHRSRYGDDVVLHDPDDDGGMFTCGDCSWVVVYAPVVL